MGKRKYCQIEKSRETPVRYEDESEKERKDSSKREKKSKSRERWGHRYQGKRRKLQDDDSNEEMIIKNERQDIKIVNEKDVLKWYQRWNLSSQD